ncbi:MAG: KH domain-containing protein [Acidimicrobiia bacterium]
MSDEATRTAEADPTGETGSDDAGLDELDSPEDRVTDDIEDDTDEDFDDDFDDATCAERVLETCLRAIVDRPEEIDIGVDEHDRRLTLHVRVASEDMGKIIGKRGRVANALRTLIKAAGSREGYSAAVEIDD